jgi:hypothetical protein
MPESGVDRARAGAAGGGKDSPLHLPPPFTSHSSSPSCAQISDMFKQPGETTISLGRKIISGLLSGGIGITIANVSRGRVCVTKRREGKGVCC